MSINAQRARESPRPRILPIFVLTCVTNIDVTIHVAVMKDLPQKIEQLLLARYYSESPRNMWYIFIGRIF